MKRKKCIPDAQDIQAQGPIELTIIQLDPADEQLPAPLGKIGKQPEPSAAEVLKLKRTQANGGLIDWTSDIGKPARARVVNIPGKESAK